MSETGKLSENSFKDVLYHFIIACAAISKACVESGMGHDESYTLSDIYIRKADKCVRSDELITLYGEMQLDFAERMSEIKKQNATSLHVRKCIDYVYGHINGDLSVGFLAKHCGISASYLSSLFSEETGQSLKSFVTHARIDTAQNLLRYAELSSLEISASLGFSSQSAFINVFRKITGMTPKKYREKYYASEQ